MSVDVNWQSPIFVVGASRSGTAMMRSILMQDPQVSLAGETHYFDDLRPRYIGQRVSEMSQEDRDKAADYFRAISVRPYGMHGNPEESWFSRDELLADAAAIGDDIDSIFEAYCKKFAGRDKATIWGEKTPRHVFRIDDILALYPQARVICMVRDPRAVVASYRDWRTGETDLDTGRQLDKERVRASYNIVLASLMWRAAANASLLARKTHGDERVRIVRYETVINQAEETVRDVVQWLGLDYSDELLAVPLHNSSTMEFDRKAGISKTPQNRWRQVLSDREIGVIQKTTGQSLIETGFALEPVRTGPLDVPLAYAGLPFHVLRAARANRDRFNSLPRYAMRRLKAVLKI
jgi:Sulfotransferase family